jgi:hypothetical protein
MKPLFLLIALILAAFASGCYYDKESDLYPQQVCDTTDIKWSTVVRPIINEQCAYAGCHAGAGAQAGIDLSTYQGVKNIVDNGSLMGSITHQGNYPFMPYQAAKLPDCTIARIRIWVDSGAKQN